MIWHARTGMAWWMLFGGILWIAFWATVVYLAVTLFRHLEGSGRRQPRPDAIEIARQRYARGEITRDQFEQLRRDLAS